MSKRCLSLFIFSSHFFHFWYLKWFFLAKLSFPEILVGCFGFNDPLRQYFSLYRAVSQREGEKGEK